MVYFRSIGILFTLISFSVYADVKQPKLTAEKVLNYISANGATKTVADYYDKQDWKVMMKGISSGNTKWLKVYSLLNPIADASAGEDIGEAIFDALPSRPFQVLPLLTADSVYTVEQVCTFTFEDKVPSGGVNKYLTRLERSLEKANSKSQYLTAQSCIRGINATKATFMKDKNY